MLWFECACVPVVLLTLVVMARTQSRSARALLSDYFAIAVAAWLGESTCIALYRHYDYAPAWHLRLLHVPLLVPLIWPLVILSARQVANSLWPGRGIQSSLRVALVVAFDASLVEVVAVAAGLWAWSEPGHLGVPLVGIAGWAYFALAVDIVLSSSHRWRHLALIVIAPAVTHALLIATWWGGFRWGLRRSLTPCSTYALIAMSLIALVLVLRARRAGHAIPLEVAGPRVIAAALFVTLLVVGTSRSAPLLTHAIAIAVPYLAGTRLRSDLNDSAAHNR